MGCAPVHIALELPRRAMPDVPTTIPEPFQKSCSISPASLGHVNGSPALKHISDHLSLMSSANLMNMLSITSSSLVMKTLNITGPKIESCGTTPARSYLGRVQSITIWVQTSKYFFAHLIFHLSTVIS